MFVRWGGTPGQPYVGVGPTGWAHTTARLGSEVERSLADEAAGPLAQLLAVPQDGGNPDGDDDDDGDPLASLRGDLSRARGRALLVETTALPDGERAAHPRHNATGKRLVSGQRLQPSWQRWAVTRSPGPWPPAVHPQSLFTADADGTAQREALRRWHMGTVLPLARLLEAELRAKLEADVRLRFDPYALDVQGRAAGFAKMVTGGVSVEQALTASGLLDA